MIDKVPQHCSFDLFRNILFVRWYQLYYTIILIRILLFNIQVI